MKRRSERGFTVYELLITLLIVGIVLVIGVPNLSDFTKNGRIAATVNDLHSSFLVARSEAARAKASVTICASADPLAAGADCDGAGFDDGWIIFLDLNGDIARAGAGENVLRRHAPVPDTIDITANAGATYFSFSAAGLGRGDVAGAGPSLQSAMVCDQRGNTLAGGGYSAARQIVVTPLGRSTVIREVGMMPACP